MRGLLVIFIMSVLTLGEAKVAKITPDMTELKIKKDGKEIIIKRENNKIPPMYQKPLIGMIAPFKVDKDIETIGELEVLDYIKKSATDDSIVLVDARTENWYDKIRIPTAINVPYTLFSSKSNAIETLTFNFDVEEKNGKLDFSKAKTLVIYCNGAWCGQSIQLIKDAKFSLIKLGYPKEKIKYYRGGMQSWVSLGLTTESK